VVRAYLLGYASAVGPRLLTLLLQHVARRRRNETKSTSTARSAPPEESYPAGLQRILRGGLDWQRFPTFCAVLVGGTTLLEASLTCTA
jgi:hypothetical protein